MKKLKKIRPGKLIIHINSEIEIILNELEFISKRDYPTEFGFSLFRITVYLQSLKHLIKINTAPAIAPEN
jgi:hypothetical protein